MMKRIFSILTLTICMIMTAACASNNSNSATPTQTVINDQNNFRMKTKILFINGSENRDGNTSHMAKELLGNIPYDQLNLVDYRVDSLGQHFEGDQFSTVLNAMQQADIIIIGTPIYWHTMSGSLKNTVCMKCATRLDYRENNYTLLSKVQHQRSNRLNLLNLS